MEQIQLEYEAAHRLMYGPDPRRARYEFIHARLENMFDRCHERLIELVGGMREGVEALAGALEQVNNSQGAPPTRSAAKQTQQRTVEQTQR